MFDNLRFNAWIWYYRKFRKLDRAKASKEEIEFYELLERNTRLQINKPLLKLTLKYVLDLTEHAYIFENETSPYLSTKGRSILRRLIHEEKERRFENAARWVKLLAPLIASIAGILGIITGLVAVLQHKK